MVNYYRKDDSNKQPVAIAKDNPEDSFYQMSDGQMIKKNIFSKYYDIVNSVTESVNTLVHNEPPIVPQPHTQQPIKQPSMVSNEIDPSTFFNKSSLDPNVVNQIKTVDTSRISDTNIGAEVKVNIPANQVNMKNQPQLAPTTHMPQMNESAIIQQEQPQTIPNHTNTDVSQYKVYDNDEDAYNDFINKQPNSQVQQPQQPVQQDNIDELYENEKMAYGEEEATNRRLIRLKRQPLQAPQAPQATQTQINTNDSVAQPSRPQLNPNEIVFSTFKRKHDISVTVEFKDKIGKPDFVKMMVENMEGDIVQYYKKLIISNIYKNIRVIEDQVEKQIIQEIFGDEIPEEYLLKKEEKVSSEEMASQTLDEAIIEEPIIEESIIEEPIIEEPIIEEPIIEEPIIEEPIVEEPIVDESQVIIVEPDIIKENKSKPELKEEVKKPKRKYTKKTPSEKKEKKV